MPLVYFKTKVQNNYKFPDGSSEQYYLELMTDEITSCLNGNAISYKILTSNYNDFTNSDKEYIIINLEVNDTEDTNKQSKIKILFTEGNPMSKRMSDILLRNITRINDQSSPIEIVTDRTTSNQPSINSITVIFENMLNPKAIEWIRQNIEEISVQFIMSLTEYFGLPFVPCNEMRTGMAKIDESLRLRPNLNSEIVGSVEANKKIDVLGQWEDWYIVGKNNNLGYIQTKFIEI